MNTKYSCVFACAFVYVFHSIWNSNGRSFIFACEHRISIYENYLNENWYYYWPIHERPNNLKRNSLVLSKVHITLEWIQKKKKFIRLLGLISLNSTATALAMNFRKLSLVKCLKQLIASLMNGFECVNMQESLYH